MLAWALVTASETSLAETFVVVVASAGTTPAGFLNSAAMMFSMADTPGSAAVMAALMVWPMAVPFVWAGVCAFESGTSRNKKLAIDT